MSIANFINANKQIVAIVAIILIVVSLGLVLRSGSNKSKVDMDRFTSIGAFSGEAIAEHLGSGKTVVVVKIDYGPNIALQKQDEAFFAALEKGGINVADTEFIRSDGDGSMDVMMMMNTIPGPRFLEIADRHKDKDALVSLVGMPITMVKWPSDAPPIVVGRHMGILAGGGRQLFEAGVVTMGVFANPVPPRLDQKTGSYRKQFDENFMVVTAENAHTLP